MRLWEGLFLPPNGVHDGTAEHTIMLSAKVLSMA